MFVTNLFSHKFLDHWSAPFTLTIEINQITGFHQAMKTRKKDCGQQEEPTILISKAQLFERRLALTRG